MRGGLELAQPARPPPGARGCAGAAAARPGSGSASSRSTSAPQARGVVDVARAVRGDEHVLARRDARARQRRVVGARARLEEQRDVDHHVARRARRGPATCSRSRLATAVSDGHEQQVGEVVGEDAVELLGHRAVERAHARPRRARRGCAPAPRPARRRASSSCRRRRARRPARSVGQQRPERGEHARRLLGVRAAVDAELALGPRDAELLDEDRATARRRGAGRCGRAARRARRAAARETAAALTNCGRLPMTVTTRTASARGGAELLRDLRAHALVGVARQRRRRRRQRRAPSIEWTGSTSRTVEARNASCTSARSSAVIGRSRDVARRRAGAGG